MLVGDLSADEDITIEGMVDGQVATPDHHVTVGPTANVKARLIAREVTVSGTLEGSILATERVRVLASASVRAHITSPSLLLSDGATFTGTVDPERTEAAMHVARYRQKHTDEQ
jgi:cytoskeletal protein CcmA (bactofilin family)